MDLFDDLPEPTQTSGPVSAAVTAQPQSTKEEEEEEVEKRLKRKREDAECDKKGEEEVKKFCKEGFHLFHHNVCLLFLLQLKSIWKYDV